VVAWPENMRKKTRLALLASGMALGILVAPRAEAQSSADKAAAEALFQAGRDLMGAGKFDDACKKFEASQRLDAGLGTLLYLADCYEKANRLASAWATFREAESIAMGRSDQSRAQVAKERYAALEPRLSKLWIKVADGNDAATEVKRDGEPIPRESWGIALPTDAGDHTIEAMAPGRKPWSTKVVVQHEAESVPVDVPVLEAAPSAAPAPAVAAVTASPEQPGSDAGTASAASTQRTLGIVFGAVGVAGLGVGSYFGLKAKSKYDDSLAFCNPDDKNRCTQEGVNRRDEALTAAHLSTAFMIGGGAFLAGGIVLFLTAPSGKAASATRHGLQVAAGMAPGGGRVTLGGAF
jgi:hypothetical protein